MSTAMIALPAMRAPTPGRADYPAMIFGREPIFAAAGLFVAALTLPMAAALAMDTRTLDGIDVWIKPLKFEVALAIYLLTLAVFANWLPAGTTEKRWFRVYSGIVVAAILAELVCIGGAGALGTRSHFNQSLPLGVSVYAFMGVSALVLTSATLVYGVLVHRSRDTVLAPALKASLVDGLLLTFVLTLVVAGTMSTNGSHFVGGNGSDIEALPLFGWARDGGDLRVAHLFATHAMHFIPAFGLVSAVAFGRDRQWPVHLFALAFTAFVAFAFIQALMGLPFIA